MFTQRTAPGSESEEIPFGIPPLARIGLATVGALLVTLLAVAANLEPDQRGYGTHRQLGLPPCTFKMLAGMRCPSCGMTTSWSHLMRGQVPSALAANVGGVALGAVAMGLGPWMLVSGIRGRWLLGRPRDALAVTITVGVIIVTLLDWIVRLFITG